MIHSLRRFCIFSLLFLVFSTGCQHAEDKPKESGEKLHQKTESTDSQDSNAVINKDTRIQYLADLMTNKQFHTTEEYNNELSKNPAQLRSNIVHHGKAKSIFHHPIPETLQNTLSFRDISVRAHTQLKFSVGLFTEECQASSDGVGFQVMLEEKEAGRQVLFEKTAQPSEEWQEYAVDLSRYAGRTVTLDLTTAPLMNLACDWAVWGSPRIVQYSIETEHETKEIQSAQRHKNVISRYHETPFTNSENRTDRGWVLNARTTDILLADVSDDATIRNEIYVVDRSGKQDETVSIELLDDNDKVLASSASTITAPEQVISDEYTVAEHNTRPAKVRIRLDSENQSILFFKEPIIYARHLPADEPTKPHVILISLDTLRADHLGCYGYQRDVSPNLDALAAESVIFTNTYSNSNWTLPSHTSMFTSLYPSEHQISLKTWHNGYTLAYEGPYRYITEDFKDADYLTIAFTGGGFVDSQYGFNKGFDYHVENVTELNTESLDLLLSLIEKNKDIPQFVFFHTFEIHDFPREKPIYRKYVQTNFQRDDSPLIAHILLQNKQSLSDPIFNKIKNKLLPEAGIQYIHDLYDGAIAYTDTQLGRFFKELQQMGYYDNAWIVITADHGEGFGERHNNSQASSWYHGSRLYDNQIRIPLIIKPPKQYREKLAGERRIEQLVQTIDIPPTLLSILGAAPHEQFKGNDLLPLLTGHDPWSERTLFSENINKKHLSLIKENYKLILMPRGDALLSTMNQYNYQLYNLRDDPAEQRNLVKNPKYAPIVNELKQALWEHIGDLLSPACSSAGSSPGASPSDSEKDDVDQEHLERLKDLGYL